MAKKAGLLVSLLLLGMLGYHAAFAQPSRDCNQNQICVQPGDHLKYLAQVYNNKGTITYTFGDLLNSDTIKVAITTIAGNQTINGQSLLSLKNTTLINSDGSRGPFFFMVLTPINSAEVATSPFKNGTDTFNGYQRSVLVLQAGNGTDSEEVKVDKDTGVLLEFKVSHSGQVSGQQVTTGTSFVLSDTNIITSSNIQGTGGTPTVIPHWIKNTAGWWSTGAVSDSEFVSAMQYLIQQGILKIPQTTQSSLLQSSQIPTWIKTNAGWWANGQISDDEFIKGIQYLITNGIIKIR